MSLSIVIPHFNASDLIENLLASIPKNKQIQIIYYQALQKHIKKKNK